MARVDCDLLVIGSGAAGLSAAVTARAAWPGVVVAEREPVFGGTTAWSGGWMWTPCNPLARAQASSRTSRAAGVLRNVLGPTSTKRGERVSRGRAAHGHVLRGAYTRSRSKAEQDPRHLRDVAGCRHRRAVGLAAPYDARTLGTSSRGCASHCGRRRSGPHDPGRTRSRAFMNVTRSRAHLCTSPGVSGDIS